VNLNIQIQLIQPLVFEFILEIRNHSILFYLGITLVLGFVFMLIVDNCSSRLFHHHGSQGLDLIIYLKLFIEFLFISY
jgi:hypothetical protein